MEKVGIIRNGYAMEPDNTNASNNIASFSSENPTLGVNPSTGDSSGVDVNPPRTSIENIRSCLNIDSPTRPIFQKSEYFYKTPGGTVRPYYWFQRHNRPLPLYELDGSGNVNQIPSTVLPPFTMPNVEGLYIHRTDSDTSWMPYNPGIHKGRELAYVSRYNPVNKQYTSTGIVLPNNCPVFIANHELNIYVLHIKKLKHIKKLIHIKKRANLMQKANIPLNIAICWEFLYIRIISRKPKDHRS